MSTPRCIARDIFPSISALIGDAGVCATSERGKAQIIFNINLIQDAILTRIDPESMLYDWPVPVRSGCFALPIDCESERNIFINGFPAIQRDQWFEGKMAWGRNNYGGDCRLQCIDQGQFAIPLPFPKTDGIRVALIAEHNGDAGKEVHLELINRYGDRLQETVTLLANGEPALSANVAYDVTMVSKDETDGVVQLQLRYDDGARFFMARYPAKCRQGYFRRKKLPQGLWGCNEVVIKGKMKYYPISSETDVLPFHSLMAWRFGAAAISAQTRGEMDAYNENIGSALREISRSMQNSDPSGNQAPIKFTSGFGTNPSWAGGRGRCWA